MRAKLLAPGLFWLIAFFGCPFLIVFLVSFGARSETDLVQMFPLTLENYLRAFQPIYGAQFLNSVRFALWNTGICVLLGFPLSYFIVRQSEGVRNFLLFCVVLPFMTNFLVRIYAWFTLLRPQGLVGQWMQQIGITTPLLNSEIGIIIGLVYGYLPLMVLPIYASMEKLNVSLIEAAQDLGASQWRVFLHVIIPLSKPGLLAGCMLVFIPTVGEFIVPKMLGGGTTPVIGTLIEEQFLGKIQSNWPFGAALTVLLMLFVAPAIIVRLRNSQNESTFK